MSLREAIANKEILVVCGAGGVGKTSVSAALALEAARTRKVIVLTIDPARRLASALGLGDLFAGDVTDQFGEPVWTISQGPQVLVDAQATPLADGLMINWDVRVDAFPPGVPEAMFA